MADQEKIKPYDHPAGGWGSLITGVRHVARQEAVTQTVKSLLRVNQPDGFDCPGCAWPEPKQGHTFEFCENGIKAVAWEATGKRVTPEFFQQHTVGKLATWSDHDLEKQGRLTQPMRYNRDADRYEPIEWQQAFELIAEHLNALNHPDEAIFYTSGRTSNEAAFLYQLLARRLGTNNMPDCSNMCHESSGAALSESIGIGKGTVTLEDFELADAIFVIGQNPGTNHPRMLAELEKAAKRGCKIVALNPLRERGLERFLHPQHPIDMMLASGSAIASHYFQPLIGGDLAAITGVIKLVLEHPDKLDKAFIDQHTTGFDEMATHVNAAEWSMIEREAGLTRAELQQIADIYLQSERVIICWAMGLTQHKHAVSTIQALMNLLLLRGNLGRPGAGACPVRGHSNVQGDRTVGIDEKPSQDYLDRVRDVFGFEPPRGHGHHTVESVEAMENGTAKVFIGMGGNFVRAIPDT
ncbi:MAG: FdhF/YdeP family oxidoreductase, partial [Caldilineales bacterium]|nr:FdhF/YdeP family oxidoreductase [Caldilineales bacterium]